jgi:iron complex transport system ATP-binding protein
MCCDFVIEMENAKVWVNDTTTILQGIDWRVRAGEHWALIGPNGSGKSTLLSLAAATRHPSSGSVGILGGRMGKTSVWELKKRIGVVDPSLRLYDWLTVEDVVLTGATGAIQPKWGEYSEADLAKAHELLALLGCLRMKDREIKTCSQGERQRVRIARALMPSPPLLLLDEPATGLDLPAREALIAALRELAGAQPTLATVLVSHHLEELPPTTTHALLLRDGLAVASGPIEATITNETVSACFGLDVEVRREHGRYLARASADWRPGMDA